MSESTRLGVNRSFRRRKQLEQDLAHITQEMYRRNRELAETNRTLSLLRTVDALVLESQEPIQVVAQQIAQALTDTAEYTFVALLVRPSLAVREIELCGWSTKLPMKLPISKRRTPHFAMSDHPWIESEAMSWLIPIHEIEIADIRNFLGCSEAEARVLKKLPIKTLYATKLMVQGHMVGVMITGFYADPDVVTEQDTRLLERLSEPIGIALDNRLLFEENRLVVSQLRRSNAKLKALDETKDEFITMASHQLRTPLTSVKGYLSMVLEGDVGKLNAQQEKLLTQSYASAQRMVYLISDLLNLSRLNTGKFVIEPTEVDLREVVRAEMEQLVETARAREVEMVYDGAPEVAGLMLDETKIHQVVMNFLDNAIYYTPAGGKIRVSLHETSTAIECRIRDNGIGVPRAAQHRLFSKFYRADNAQRARPDGTGLGLFMAKKVIVAQGGAIIFESEEGKGSTFGFRFAKVQPTTTEGK
jgi:signal transduction histidine kinase